MTDLKKPTSYKQMMQERGEQKDAGEMTDATLPESDLASGTRAQLLGLVHSLGASWTVSLDSSSREILRHTQLECDFVLVRGGVLRMGLVEQDRLPLQRHMEWNWCFEDRWTTLVELCTPPHEVVVAPFLCAIACVAGTPEGGRYLNLSRERAIETAKRLGFRLPSEAEFEWIAREGGGAGFNSDLLHGIDEQNEDEDYWPDPKKLNRFGVRDLFLRQWVADDWHPSYHGAPSTSATWHDGDPRGVLRGDDKAGSFELGPEVLLDQLAAARWPGDTKERPFRLVLDLPVPTTTVR